MKESGYAIGMVGLGVMGRNLLLNIADHGYSAAGYDRDAEKTKRLNDEAGSRDVAGIVLLEDFVSSLAEPRIIILLVPAGPPVDAAIDELLPHLKSGDCVIDGGNSYFRDTDRRIKSLSARGISFLGIGISGGEHGARYGPSIMPGGEKEAYERVRPVFEAIAARVNDDTCVAYLGPGSAGHYVKMVHNGIEYGLMQLISETYHLMKTGLGMTNDELRDVYAGWHTSNVNSYLIDITAHIFSQKDPATGASLIDMIRDEARQKGTGLWTSQEAMTLHVPLSTIDVAVAMRDLSDWKQTRMTASRLFADGSHSFTKERGPFQEQLRNALYLGMLTTFAQGLRLLIKASHEYGYQLVLSDIVRIWRGGCIIHAGMLESIRSAFLADADQEDILLDKAIAHEIQKNERDLRDVVRSAVGAGIPAPGLMSTLAYLDGFSSPWLPMNLIQAQRDYFGSHTYERVDVEGQFHTEWEQE